MSEAKFDGYYDGFKALSVESEVEECRKLYADFSETYDKTLSDDLNYGAPVVTVELLCKHLQALGYSNDTRILDLGCGSGLVGQELNKRGYKNIDGVDLCAEMLVKAKEKGVYTTLAQGEMASEGCKKLGVAADQYDIVTCVGVMTHGHVKGKGFDDLVHPVKPGGLVCFTVRRLVWEDPAYGYAAKIDELCNAKKWKLIEKKYDEHYTVDDGCWVFCFQIL